LINKKDLTNLISLAGIHGSNALFPLVVFPYLFLMLNENEFSVIVVSESIVLYILAICLYSFDISGVKDIVANIQNKKLDKVGEIYWSIFLVRILIFFPLSALVLFIAFVFFETHLYIILLWLMFPLGMILQSNYYFQATETNIKLSLLIFIARVSSCILIYIFIKESGSSLMATGFLAGSFMASGLASIGYVIYSLGVKRDYFKFDNIMTELKKGRAIFIGNFSVSLFRGSNILILSVVSNPLAVSIYSLAEKIVKSLQALSRPLNELAFPKIVKGINSSNVKSDAPKIIWNNTRHQILIMLLLIPVFIGGLHLILYYNVWDKLDTYIVNLITIMVFAIFFGIANFMYGSVGLNVLGFHRYYALAISAAGAISLLSSVALSYAFHEIGASVSFVLGEALLFTFFYVKYRRIGSENHV